LRIDFIDNPVLAPLIADMIRLKVPKFMKKGISLIRIYLNGRIVLF
jgi:hypothetical protein